MPSSRRFQKIRKERYFPMAEKLYTIPINEAFDNAISGETYDCPICLLQSMLENNELEIILGASMM